MGDEIVFEGVTHRKINDLPTVATLLANSRHGHCRANRRIWSAGKLPGSVLTRYDLLGTYVHGRLQYAY